MSTADRKYKADFLAKGFKVGSRCSTPEFGVGTIERIGGNLAFVAFDSDAGAGQRVVLFERIQPPEAVEVDAMLEAYWASL